MKIGVFGSAFNPPHRGHLDVISQSLDLFDQVLLVPSISHPFGKQMLEIYHRLNMLRLFVDEFLSSTLLAGRVAISESEKLIADTKGAGEAVFTYDVMAYLQNEYRGASLSFIVGPDNAQLWQRFHRCEEIISRWGLFIAKEHLKIRSSNIRAAIASEGFAGSADSLTASSVAASYIIDRGLYREDQ